MRWRMLFSALFLACTGEKSDPIEEPVAAASLAEAPRQVVHAIEGFDLGGSLFDPFASAHDLFMPSAMGNLASFLPLTAQMESATVKAKQLEESDFPPKVVPVPNADPHACPTGMVLVEGESCTEVEHTCLNPMKDDPARRCLEFKVGADVCVAPKGKLRFCMDRYEWPGVPGVQPRVLVDYFEAEKSCKSVGKRMCKEDEFYLACEGPEHWPYAWGHTRHPSACNIDRPYLMVDWVKWAKGGEPMREEARRLDQALPIGSSRCWSPYGIHDIAGNVDEWTKSRPGRDLEGSLNGGYWGPVQNACRYVTLVHGPEFMFYQIGFRCCSDAKS